MKKINIRTIPHKKQRYDTCGDYFKSKDTIQFRISKTNADYEFLVMIHELVEWYLTQKRGITIKEIDNFDLHYVGDDPGADPDAPYHKEHMFATFIEQVLADELGIDWWKYDQLINQLQWRQ